MRNVYTATARAIGLTCMLCLMQAEVQFAMAAAARTPEELQRYGEQYCNASQSADSAAVAIALRSVFSEHTLGSVGIARLQAQLTRLRQAYGPLTFHHAELRVVQMGDRVSRILHVFAQAAERQSWHDLQFRLESDPPHRLNELAFVAEATAPVSLPEGGLDDPQVRAWLDDYVTTLARSEQLSGAILIARGDSVLLERYVGTADSRGTPVTAATRFSLASGGKMFTAVAVARLIEQGKLTFDSRLTEIVAGLPDSGAWPDITVRHLLTHTSGVAEFWVPGFDAQRENLRDHVDYLPRVVQGGIQFDPGTRFDYSNSNFILAGLIVEQVSGQSYFDYLEANIFAPLEMSDTGQGGGNAPLAIPLVRAAGGRSEPEFQPSPTAAGGCYSTVRDMWKWSKGLQACWLVSAELTSQLTSSQVLHLAPEVNYGYGFELSNPGEIPAYGHGGIAPGVNAEFRYIPGVDITFVLFCNQDNAAFDDLKRHVITLISRADP